MTTSRLAFTDGARAILPFLIGVVVFGMVAGHAARAQGMSPSQAAALAGLLFAGAAELVTLDLLARGAPWIVVVATALVVNARLAVYAASFAPHLAGLGGGRRAGVAALLTDQPFALTWRGFAEVKTPAIRAAFFVGAALPMWATWQAAHFLGYHYGASVPPSLSLDFAVPLTFVAILVPSLREQGTRRAALVGGLSYPWAAELPLELGLIAAALVGVVGAGWMGRERR